MKIDISTGKISDYVRFDTGVVVMCTGGRNMGRVGVVTHRERHDGGFNIVHIKDAVDNAFATRESNVFVIGQEKPWISLPKGKGVKVCVPQHLSIKRVYVTNICSSSLLLRSVTAAVLMLSPSKSTKRGRVSVVLKGAPNKSAEEDGILSSLCGRV